MDAAYFKDKLIKYLPSFVVESEIRDALLTAIAQRLLELYDDGILVLPDANWSGRGLLLEAEENKIFWNNRKLVLMNPGGEFLILPDGETPLLIRSEDLGADILDTIEIDDGIMLLLPDGLTWLTISETMSSEPPIRARLEQRLQYWIERGTRQGIQKDIEAMFGLDFSTIILHDVNETGIIVDVTSFDDDNFIDADNMVELQTADRGYIVRRAEDDLLIRKYILPINAELIIKGN